MIQIFKQCINFFKNWYQVFLLLLGFGLLYMYGTMQVKSLDRNTAYTKGKIIRIGPCARNGNCVEYKYFVNRFEYHGSESITGEKVHLDSCFEKEWTIGFDSLHPRNSKIIGFRIGEVDTVKHLIKNW